MQELYPGIFQINITLKGFSPGSVNLYVFQDQSHLTLIDTGWDLPEAVEFLQFQLGEAGLHFKDIKKVLVTHCHSDHLGMINRLKKLNGAEFYLHHRELEIVKVRYSPHSDYWQKTDQFLFTHGLPPHELPSVGYPLPEISELTPPDVWLQGGELIPVGDYTLQVINTPGHSPGHVAYYEPHRKLIFSGDTLLPTIATNAATHIQHMINPLRQYLDSLKFLNELDISMVMPGHEYPFSGHRERISELFEHHRLRSESIQHVFQNNPQKTNAYQVAQLITWSHKAKTVSWDQLSTLDKRFAMMQSVAHLEMLAFSEKLIRLSQNGKMYYQASFPADRPK
jgi:glyoxylase-like metal-dependent hydrolase (beta-lactamase superfamily II)